MKEEENEEKQEDQDKQIANIISELSCFIHDVKRSMAAKEHNWCSLKPIEVCK